MSNDITEEDYRRLKSEVEEAVEQAQRARGALDQLMRQLEEEFGCKTLKQAKLVLEELRDKRDRLQEKFNQAVKEYNEKWKGG
jgi:predicted  nucleic acid-binding Zn-ribbon protein